MIASERSQRDSMRCKITATAAALAAAAQICCVTATCMAGMQPS